MYGKGAVLAMGSRGPCAVQWGFVPIMLECSFSLDGSGVGFMSYCLGLHAYGVERAVAAVGRF